MNNAAEYSWASFGVDYMFLILLDIDIKVELLGYKVRVELLVTLMFTFLRTAKLFSKWLYNFTFPPAGYEGFTQSPLCSLVQIFPLST